MLKSWKIKTKFLFAIGVLGVISLAGLMYVAKQFSDANVKYSGFLQHESLAANYSPRGAAGMWTATTWLTRALAQDPATPAFKDFAERFTKEVSGARGRIAGVPDLMPSRKQAVDELLAGMDEITAIGKSLLEAHAAGDEAKVHAGELKLDAAVLALSPKFGANNSATADAMTKGGETLSRDVDQTIFIAIVGLLIGIGVAVAATVAIAHYGVTAPMTRLNRRMVALAAGDTAEEIDGRDRRDEIGEMAAAVAVFRDHQIDRLRLEQQAEADRGMTELERMEREKQRAQETAEVQFAVQSLAHGLSRLSDGDVSFRLNEPFAANLDGVRADFNSSLEKLQLALIRVSANARGIDGGANEIKSAANNLAKRTEQQAAAVEETAAALEEITTTVKDATLRAQEAGSLVARTKTGAEQSGDVVRKAVVAMERIEKSSAEISNIIGVIDEIAFQTNLLALNAGVEAARAGEAGKGFAVVAQEVRELAQRSANAAKEIKSLITASNTQVREGVQLVGDTGSALATIVAEVQEINRHVAAIVEAAQEQSAGLQQINTAVNQMDQDTQQNAAMVEETTAASNSLASEINSLNQLIAQFRLGDQPVQRVSVAPAAAVASAAPVASPARALARKVATAFKGNAAPAPAKENWEEF